MAGDSWLSDYDACTRLGQDIMEKLNQRNREPRTSTAYTKLSAQVRTSIRQFNADVNRLKENLLRASTAYHITQREVDRRQVMMDTLLTKEKQIDQAFKNDASQDSGRSSLFNQGGVGGWSSDPWGEAQETEQTRNLSGAEIRQHQQHLIREQDRGLDGLANVVARQKQMALDIGEEVDYHNEIIDDITDHTDRTHTRLIKETRHVAIIEKKSGSCAMLVVIVLLFIAIIVVAVIPS